MLAADLGIQLGGKFQQLVGVGNELLLPFDVKRPNPPFEEDAIGTVRILIVGLQNLSHGG